MTTAGAKATSTPPLTPVDDFLEEVPLLIPDAITNPNPDPPLRGGGTTALIKPKASVA